MKRFFPALLLLAVPALAQAQTPLPKVPPGFKVELVTQAPDLEHPTALAVAPNGDVYVAEDPMDMRGPSNKPADKVWVLKNGDPKNKILIADKLWAVMGLELVRDKLFCVHYPYVSVFTLDAEGKAIKREDLFTDLGPKGAPAGGFNDHVPSGIKMGMDGWLYVSIGDKGIPKMTKKEKNSGSVEVAEGRWRYTKEGNHISLEGGGVIRFRPDGSGLEVFASGTRNHLDVPMDEHDRIFVRDNTNDGGGWDTRFMYLPQGAFLGYPWAFTQRPKEALPMIRDFGGGSPCGGYVYCDDGLPEKYRGRIFHCEWGKGKVFAVKVAPNGAGFKFVDEIVFMDPTGTGVKDFRPFTLRPTADGRGFYVTDWNFGGWSQKPVRGRLWKVTYTGDDVKPMPRGKDTDSVEELIKALDHPAHTERLRAQRAMLAAPEKYLKILVEKWEKGVISPRAMQHAVWVFASGKITVRDPKRFPDEKVLIEAVRAGLFGNPEPVGYFGRPQGVAFDPKTQLALYRKLLEDPSPQVRLHAVNRFQQDVGPLPFALLENERDPWVRFALIRVFKEQPQDMWKYFLTFEANYGQLSKRLPQSPIGQEGLLQALADTYHIDAVKLLVTLSEKMDVSFRQRAIETLARVYKDRKPYAGGWWGTRPEQQKPPARIVAWEGTPIVREAIVKALSDKASEVRVAAIKALVTMNDPDTFEPLIAQFGKESDPSARADLVRAISGQKSPFSLEFLSRAARDGKQPLTVRLEAVTGLELIGQPVPAKGKGKGAGKIDPNNNLVHLRDLAASTTASEVRARALEALGNLKAKNAEEVCLAILSKKEMDLRKTAIVTLGKIGATGSVDRLLPLLNDADNNIKLAAIQTLGELKVKKTVPALLPLAHQEATQFDAVTALAKMPDGSALTAYLVGLGSKNADLRTASRQAIAAIRTEALPALKQLAERSELRADLLPELRSIYATTAPILSWKLIGPFPRDDKAHPPEKELKFDAVYQSVAGKVQWRDAKGDPKLQGKVDLLKLFTPKQDAAIYGYAQIDSKVARDAVLLVGSDDTITIWLNGKQVHQTTADRGWKFDADKVKVTLQAGKNELLVKVGNSAGPWDFSVAVPGDDSAHAFLQGGMQKHDLESFRAYAQKSSGDTGRGLKLFNDLKGLACIKCHAVGGEGGKVGPDLAGIALRYKKDELITSILEPSKQIANGYETHIVTTAAGKIVTGVFKGDDGEKLNLMDPEGKLHSFAKKDIEERRISPISTMPNGLNEGMTLQDFSDLIAYLEARREIGAQKQ